MNLLLILASGFERQRLWGKVLGPVSPQSHVCPGGQGGGGSHRDLEIWSCAFTLESPDGSHFPRSCAAAFSSDLSRGAGVIHAAAHLNLGLAVSEGPEL